MFSNLVYFYENVCKLEQVEVSGKKKESTAGGVLVMVLYFGRKVDLWCLEKEAPGEEGVGSFLGIPRQEIYTW